MEDASGTDLDWFWRGWFYTTDYTDIGVKEIKKYKVTEEPNEKAKAMAKRYGMTVDQLGKNLYLNEIASDGTEVDQEGSSLQDIATLNEYLSDNFSKEEREEFRDTKYFYEIVFEKPGGLVMPILAEITYADGSKENKYYPAEIWRFNDKEVKKIIGTEKEITGIKIDPNQLTSDVNLENNSWPRKESESKFDTFQKKITN
jgi:hypothetical protein